MIKRKFDRVTYQKLGRPDLDDVMYFMVSGKRIWGTVCLLSFIGFKNAKKGMVLVGISPFNKKK